MKKDEVPSARLIALEQDMAKYKPASDELSANAVEVSHVLFGLFIVFCVVPHMKQAPGAGLALDSNIGYAAATWVADACH